MKKAFQVHLIAVLVPKSAYIEFTCFTHGSATARTASDAHTA